MYLIVDKDYVLCLKYYLLIEVFYFECRGKLIVSVMGYVYNI